MRLIYGIRAFSIAIWFIRDEVCNCPHCGTTRDRLIELSRGTADCRQCGRPLLGLFVGLAHSVWNAVRLPIFRCLRPSPQSNIEHKLDGVAVGAYYQLFADQGGVALEETKMGQYGGQNAKWKQGYAFWTLSKIGQMFHFSTLDSAAAEHKDRLPFDCFKTLPGGDLAIVIGPLYVHHTRWGDTSASIYERLTVTFSYVVLNTAGNIVFHRDQIFDPSYTDNAELRTRLDIREALFRMHCMGYQIDAGLYAASQALRLVEAGELHADVAARNAAAAAAREAAQAKVVTDKRAAHDADVAAIRQEEMDRRAAARTRGKRGPSSPQ